ncbi:hypothetical protein MACH17_05060 [Phaeobacter inhibens]|uniref:hypothetical protein n=1 Tax=Phaeobacter inhibens TaxID=221822 RepID=UPI00275968B4|nr:hypothetical protein [Phaeobacter inhibens]GLO68989.1 hypothetical protein MACH17_05060 [Phaeobacter inhibens]
MTKFHLTGVLQDAFEISSTKQVVVIVDNLDGEMPPDAVLQAGDLVSDIAGIDYPRKIIDLPDGSRGLDFSCLGFLLKTGSKVDWLKHKGKTARILTKRT